MLNTGNLYAPKHGAASYCWEHWGGLLVPSIRFLTITENITEHSLTKPSTGLSSLAGETWSLDGYWMVT